MQNDLLINITDWFRIKYQFFC